MRVLYKREFFDGKEFVTESDNVLAVTVMPLTVRYVPYTFKLIGGRAEGGKALSCECDGKVYVKYLCKVCCFFGRTRSDTV